MVTNTSKAAYQSMGAGLGRMQSIILNFIQDNPGVCNLEISDRLGIPINVVTPRVNELRKMELLENSGTCIARTGRQANTWRILDKGEY